MASLITNRQQLDRFFSLCSIGGLLTIYAIKVSYEKKAAFDLHNLTKEAFPLSSDYFYGYMIACAAMELFTHNTKNNVTTVLSIDPLVSENVKEALQKRIAVLESLKNAIDKVDKYFK